MSYKILLIGGKPHNTYTRVSDVVISGCARFQIMDYPNVASTSLQNCRDIVQGEYYTKSTYDVIPVFCGNKIIDYYGKEYTLSDEEGFSLYKKLKEK